MQVERALQIEVMLRLRVLGVLAVGIPNSIFFPARTDAERSLISRIVRRMKDDGMITPGAGDLIAAANGVACFIELKREKTRDLLGKTQAAGRLSDPQKDFRDQCAKAGVAYRVCHTWPEVEAALIETGVLGERNGRRSA